MSESEVIGYCPVPKCEHKSFIGKDEATVRAMIRDHLKRNLEDPNHSDIADLEEWL